jgi:ubiquinone/menaquinone biosynthesis C-methylase UbiE
MKKILQSATSILADQRRRLDDTQKAFDSVASDYDGMRGNNALIQDMRSEMWGWFKTTFPPGGRLIDLGCGTGLDAVHLAQQGFHITATDWSPLMVERTRLRAEIERLTDRVRSVNVGAQELQQLEEASVYDGAYSNLGPLNCVPELRDVARECARLLRPGGVLVFSVIGRLCPWEMLHYLRQGRWARATVRLRRRAVPVGMNKQTIWTRYYGPREFSRAFSEHFSITHFRGLCVFAPPPYLTWVRDKYPRVHAFLWRLDRRVAGWPFIRGMGDHFLIVMRKR